MRQSFVSAQGLAWAAAGAAAMLLASRVMPPLAGRAIGTARHALGGDPFAALARDHRMVVGLLRMMEETPDGAVARRNALLFQVKRMLAAHAMAEEDVLYPLLKDEAAMQAETERLYREHADMKIRLYELERMPKHDPQWAARVRTLRGIIERHAREEEEVEFPRLRDALGEDGMARLSGDLSREKALVV